MRHTMNRENGLSDEQRQSGATLVRAELHIANRRPEAAGATGGKA
jgi:hypothetical protein